MSVCCPPLERLAAVSAIGQPHNPVDRQELLLQASREPLAPASEDKERTLLLLIDPQQDFMENGALGVPGSHADMERTLRFIQRHMLQLTRIAVSLDTHDPFQIFHPCWWLDAAGNPAPAFTTISAAAVENGRWRPAFEPARSLQYVRTLERQARKALVVWPYHCLKGTAGAAMENQLANVVCYHAVARRAPTHLISKGNEPLSEMYGIFRPEVGPPDAAHIAFFAELAEYDQIIVAGQAKSHCVLESVGQFLEHFADRPEMARRLYLLEDCMSVIPGYEAATEETFARWAREYPITRTTTRDIRF